MHRNDPPSSQLGYRNCMVGTKGMEEVETFAKVATGRFLERTLCDLVWAGIGQVDKMFAPAEELSLGGGFWRGDIGMLALGLCRTSTPVVREGAIGEAA